MPLAIIFLDIPAIAHHYICTDLATCVWIQQAQFFPFYQLSVIGDRLRYLGQTNDETRRNKG
ncbi:MAG: hypothetical protein V7K71_07790 [Nostoc sp.]|uniref:hypothetical protein n=1 Tax=Nostoc sp. TaxID=1180 RepID=UPI002FF4BEA4